MVIFEVLVDSDVPYIVENQTKIQAIVQAMLIHTWELTKGDLALTAAVSMVFEKSMHQVIERRYSEIKPT